MAPGEPAETNTLLMDYVDYVDYVHCSRNTAVVDGIPPSR